MSRKSPSHLTDQDRQVLQNATLAPEFGGSLRHGAHWFPVRVYYEDTDAEGIVYYANYLKFLERGRTEMLHSAQLTSSATLMAQGMGYVVRRVTLDYIKPARVDELLLIKTHISEVKGASMVMTQTVFSGEEVLLTGDIQIACLNLKAGGRPMRLPQDLRTFYEEHKPIVKDQ